jgi:hypothetical protein
MDAGGAMLVLIDVTGLPWARDYYRMFPFEPSRKPPDDIELARATVQYLEHPTLVDVMSAMSKAADGGETEVMLVSHGTERGLVMKISKSIPFSAEVSVLKWLPVAAELFELIDTSAQVPQNEAFLNAWARIAAFFETNGDESQIGPSADRIAREQKADANNDVIQACKLIQTRVTALALNGPNGIVRVLKTTEPALREASALTSRVRRATFKRIEIRACNIGAGPGIEALRSFFAAARLMAPTVHTFYVSVTAPDNTAAQLAHAAATRDPRRRNFYDEFPNVYYTDPAVSPPYPRFVRPFFDPYEVVVVRGPLNFMLSVTRIQTPRYTSEARKLNAKALSDWVPKFIHPFAHHPGTGPLWVGGLDGPTPQGEPYTLPQDPNYRSMIAVATPTGVER